MLPDSACVSFSEYDRVLGQDTYDVCDEQARVAYGALESYDVTRTMLVLNFTEDGARLPGVPRQAVLELALSDSDVEVLRSGLREVIDSSVNDS
jgi:hypothetical protein